MGHQKRQVEIGNFRFRHLTAIFTKQEHVYFLFLCVQKNKHFYQELSKYFISSLSYLPIIILHYCIFLSRTF